MSSPLKQKQNKRTDEDIKIERARQKARDREIKLNAMRKFADKNRAYLREYHKLWSQISRLRRQMIYWISKEL